VFAMRVFVCSGHNAFLAKPARSANPLPELPIRNAWIMRFETDS